MIVLRDLNKLRALGPLLLLGFLGAGCDKKSNVQMDDVILIGEVGTMSGSEATYGVGTHRGTELAVNELNQAGGLLGRKLKLVTLDDQGKAEEAAAATTKLITQNNVMAIVGGLPSSRSMAVASIAQAHKIPMVSPNGTNPQVTKYGDYIFRVCFIDPFQGQVMAKFALENLKIKRVAILRDVKSDYSVGLSEFFANTLKKGGGEVAADQSYGSGDIDFKSQLTAIRAKKPEAIFTPGYYTEAALIARQARELGMDIPLLGGDGWDSPKYLEIGGPAVNGNYYSTHYSSDSASPHVKKFVEKYQSTYGMIPEGLSTLGYDSVMVLADAIKRANSLKTADIRNALAATKNYQAVTGKISMDENRNPVKPAVILKVDGGKPKFEATIEP